MMIRESPSEAARADLDAWRSAASRNRFDNDPFLSRVLRRYLGDRYDRHEAALRAVADESGAALAGRIEACNRDEHLPVVRRHDADGRRIEAVEFHPDYHEVGRVFWSSGVLAGLAEPGGEVACGAIAYLLDQNGEAGHACPVACTAGAIKLIQQVGSASQRERYLPGLLEKDYASRLHAAQFVTEVQGGSDVGLNACVATPEPGRPGWYRIRGEKWFCSVADAGLFVVSARPHGAPDGTRGLGLFLVPRHVDGRPNGFTLRRLKSKLGTRSMATGEIEFEDALGEAIGPLDAGFRNLVAIVLDTSRVHNALAACGLMRRAYTEARAFAEHRTAFGRRIADFPAVRETLARMRLCGMTALLTTFRILRATDEIDTSAGDGGLAAARRIDVMINKYRTSLAGTATVRDGIEILGGNGTIDDFSVLPRLYRDAIVLESWEGTHNTLCAQVLRDFATRALHEPWLAKLSDELDGAARAELADDVARARELHGDVSRRVASLLTADADAAEARVRHVVDRMCVLSEWIGLLCQASWELECGLAAPATRAAVELYRLQRLDDADPQTSPELHAARGRLATAD